jgi:hypothetical protein
MGPKTSGGHMVATLKFGFSFFSNSHAAFSAKVLLAVHFLSINRENEKSQADIPLYPFKGFFVASSSVMGFQSCSEYVFSGILLPFDPSTIDAKDDVMITLLTLGALFFMDLSTPIFWPSVDCTKNKLNCWIMHQSCQ